VSLIAAARLLSLCRSSVDTSLFGAQDLEQLTNLVLELLGVPHSSSRIDDVAIPPPDTLPLHKPSLHEVVDDPLSRTLGDSDGARNVTKTRFGIALNSEENLRVARQEVPSAIGFRT
jgi:hypothetical protein